MIEIIFSTILSTIAWIIAIGILGMVAIISFKVIWADSPKNLKMVKIFEKSFKNVYTTIFAFFGILINLVVSIILAIGSKPIIYKINAPLGMGYATFASYVIAIMLYLLMPDWFKKLKVE